MTMTQYEPKHVAHLMYQHAVYVVLCLAVSYCKGQIAFEHGSEGRSTRPVTGLQTVRCISCRGLAR
jgi:hypothetical protein